MPRFTCISSLLGLVSVGHALLPIPNIIPFGTSGALGGCSVDTNEYNSGGSMSVNGYSIKVPKNLIAQFPAAWVPFKQLCDAGLSGFEISVSGNQVGGQAIAAQIQISQFLLQGGTGYIKTVNTGSSPSLELDGGPTIIINDPEGVYSAGTTGNELFTSDGANPSITSFSGFPMCIPRGANDDKCPSSNRVAGQGAFDAPDPLVMAPFLPGDFIEWDGILAGGKIWAYAIVATNVFITTQASDTVPNYIRMEDALIGVFDTGGNIEVADVRFVGYLSSCTGGSVTISAVDVDPCTGKESYRDIGTAVPRAQLRCKWEFRADTTAQSTYTREYLIKANNPVITTKNGIEAGQYYQPVTEWIQPEVNVPGTEPPPFRFRDIRGLVQGDFLDGKQFGPLDPFPGPNPPAPSKQCSPDDIPDPDAETPAPVADIVAFTAAVRVGARTILTGSNTKDGIPSSDLSFAWTKLTPTGTAVTINNANAAEATFEAPKVTTETTFTFELKVSLKSDPTKSSKKTVEVKVNPTTPDVVKVTSYTWESRQSGSIAVSCESNVINGDSETKKMNLIINGATGSPRAMTSSGAKTGKWTYAARSTARPTNIRCVSGLGGQSPITTTTTARRRRRGELGVEAEMSPAEWI